MIRRTLALLCVLGSLSMPSLAAAQSGPGYRPPPPETPLGVVDRRGITFGISLGGGSFWAACDGCSTEDDYQGGALDIHIGGMLNQRLAIMFDGWGVSSFQGQTVFGEDVTYTHVVATGALQYWLSSNIWIKGGIGVAQASVEIDGQTEATSEQGGALSAAAGVEILQAPHFALDLQLRIASSVYSDVTIQMVGIVIGANWY